MTELRRAINKPLLLLYGLGTILGAGIYVLVGHVAGESGGWAPLAFLIAGLVAAPTAISYAELSVRIPESAGEAQFVADPAAAAADDLQLLVRGDAEGGLDVAGPEIRNRRRRVGLGRSVDRLDEGAV